MSVYKRGATWTFHAHWTDLRGVERQHKKGGHRTRALAERAEALHLATVEQGSYVAPSLLTLGGFLTDRWLPSRTGKLNPPRSTPTAASSGRTWCRASGTCR